MIRPEIPLFVFGTLRLGERNHHYLAGRYERMVRGCLRGYERVEPLMIAERPGGMVEGEVYFLQGERYQSTMRNCDELEGIPRGTTVGEEYMRVEVEVESEGGKVRAWAYVRAGSTTDREV